MELEVLNKHATSPSINALDQSQVLNYLENVESCSCPSSNTYNIRKQPMQVNCDLTLILDRFSSELEVDGTDNVPKMPDKT